MFDPFVGTGSLLLTCSHFGAVTLGADLDPRVLRGKSIFPLLFLKNRST